MSSSSTEPSRRRVEALDPTTYRRHAIHGPDRIWPETNCYSDLIIEVIHGLGHEPLAALPFTLAIDFEGDQWTFFKPPHTDLLELYGFDIQELAIWRPLAEHVVEQVAAGHLVLVELDSWFLPDTAGTAYRLAHTKSTVGVNDIDLPARRMGYFHNAGYFALEGDDFRDVFLLEGAPHERFLPPYVEFLKRRADWRPLHGRELLEGSLRLLPRHLARAPTTNPFTRFEERLSADLPWLMESDAERFHAYSFATLRQYGACFELAASYLRWLADQGVAGVGEPAGTFRTLAETAKAFQFQLARSMVRKKPLDLAPIRAMATQWEQGLGPLRDRFA